MSHTTTLKSVAIRDVSAIRSAVRDLQNAGVKCSLVENAQPRMYYKDQHGKCPMVLKLDDSRYDVGFDKQADGTYAPVFDEWANEVAGQIGATVPLPAEASAEDRVQHQIGRFMQGYAKHAATNAATAQGYIVESSTVDNRGNVQLVLGGM